MLWRLWGESYIAGSIISLGVPIIVGQLGAIAQQFADTIMVGQYGTMELAAAGFVNNVFNFIIYLLLGISYASTPVIGAAFGRFKEGASSSKGSISSKGSSSSKGSKGSNGAEEVARSLVESVIVNFACSIVVVACLLTLYCNIDVLGQPEEIMPMALPYFLILTISVPFMAVFNALKQFSDAVGETKIPMWIMLLSNVLNIVLNWLLIFGLRFHALGITLEVPEMGLYGAGIATLISRVVSVVLLLVAILCMEKYRRFMVHGARFVVPRPTLHGMKHLLLLGLPISIQLGLEASSFNVCAIFMGWLGAIPLAAHQVMCTISTLCFQVVYGIGAAASVMISQFRGVGDWYNVRRTASSSFFIGLTVIVVMIGMIYAFRYTLVSWFTASEEVAAVIMTLLVPFFVYQFGDCMQITFANALRGIEQVKKMMFFAFVAYIVVSIPLSYFFAFVCGLGSVGVWMGMPFGLTTAGVLFFMEFRRNVQTKWEPQN